jgi:3-methyladenine DNA glycosylase AlkC
MAYKKLKLWFDVELTQRLSKKLAEQNPTFPSAEFVNRLEKDLDPLELKGRVERIADEFHWAFDEDFTRGARELVQILGPENEKETGMFTDYYWVMPIAAYVEKYGLDHWSESMYALEEITKRNTSEYAIRPFIKKHFDKTMHQMVKWSLNENKHLRRLASEGVRPRLPWAKKLETFVNDPRPILPILNNLKDDTSKYVQKSVANCLNDILKDNQEIGKEVIQAWSQGNMGKERKWIVKHALRNHIKAQEPWALKWGETH